MKFHTTKSTSLSQKQLFLLTHQSKSRKSVQHSPKFLGIIKPNKKSVRLAKIVIPQKNSQKMKQILEWRKKTQFPIVKIKDWRNSTLINQNNNKLVEIQIEMQSYFITLKQIEKISFNQAVYTLKQSLIGFERLYCWFGKFIPTSSMIFFNQFGLCKVWINQDKFTNFCQPAPSCSQNQFIIHLCTLIKEKLMKNNKFDSFFQKIEESQNFLQAIETLEKSIKDDKIRVLNCFNLLASTKNSSTKALSRKVPKSSELNSVKSFNKIPSFLKKYENEPSLNLQKYHEYFIDIKEQNNDNKIKDLQQNNSEVLLNKNILSVTKLHKSPKFLSKSPSHKVISLSKRMIKQDHKCLRQTQIVSNNFKINLHQLCTNEQIQKSSIDTNQTSFEQKPKVKKILKLIDMVRTIPSSDQTVQCQFQLEYGKKILMQKDIRNEFNNLLY